MSIYESLKRDLEQAIAYENGETSEARYEIINTKVNTISQPPKPKSILWIGDKYYRTSLPVDQHFNWFQKLMWKLCFGVKVED